MLLYIYFQIRGSTGVLPLAYQLYIMVLADQDGHHGERVMAAILPTGGATVR